MSIMSPRLVFRLCALPLLMLSCQELNPEFCRMHPDDVVCFEAGGRGRGVIDVSCVSDSECVSPTPVCEKARSICVQRTAGEPGAFNAANATVPGPGVTCHTVENAAPVFANNIVFNNATPLSFAQVSGDSRGWVYSDLAPIPPIPLVGGNIVLDPQFVDVAQGDFHLRADSPLRDAADPTATLAIGIDGEARPQGTGREMGADETK